MQPYCAAAADVGCRTLRSSMAKHCSSEDRSLELSALVPPDRMICALRAADARMIAHLMM